MKYERLRNGALDYEYVSYENSRLQFRGPSPDFSKPYYAFLGGAETFGKYMPSPYPALVSSALNMQGLNLGCVNAGPDAFLSEPVVCDLCNAAETVFVQIPGAQNLSNRFYRVHPRRNDRFVTATGLLRSVFREIDFTEFSFNGHLLRSLHRTSNDRFRVVQAELQSTWVAQMRKLLSRIKSPKVLVWFARHSPDDANLDAFDQDPLFVTREMIDELSIYVSDYCEIPFQSSAKGFDDRGLVFHPVDKPMTKTLMGQAAHMNAADHLIDALQQVRI